MRADKVGACLGAPFAAKSAHNAQHLALSWLLPAMDYLRLFTGSDTPPDAKVISEEATAYSSGFRQGRPDWLD